MTLRPALVPSLKKHLTPPVLPLPSRQQDVQRVDHGLVRKYNEGGSCGERTPRVEVVLNAASKQARAALALPQARTVTRQFSANADTSVQRLEQRTEVYRIQLRQVLCHGLPLEITAVRRAKEMLTATDHVVEHKKAIHLFEQQ